MALSFPARLRPRGLDLRALDLHALQLPDVSSFDPASLDPRRYSGAVGLAKFGATAGLHIAAWATATTVKHATDLVRDINAGEPVTEIVDARLEVVRSTVWRFLHIERITPAGMGPTVVTATVLRPRPSDSLHDLRRQGDELLRQIGNPGERPQSEHPAFSRILRELVPDEARILRFLALAGPQPAIDVRTKTPLGVGSELIAGGINLVAEMAGSTYPERNQQYLANLTRLGMIQFSEEAVEDPRRYSFIEAQPVAAAAMSRAKRTHTVYRSILITQFGKQFCEVCFTLDGYDAGGWVKDIR
jgi:hypothetical protein